MTRHSPKLLAVVLLVVAMAMAAPTSVAGASTKKPVCADKTKAKAIKAVKATWATLFDTTKTVEQRLAVVENAGDPDFKVVIDSIVTNFGSFLASATAKVHSVKCTGKKHANVAYDLVLSGTVSPGIAPPGTAVLVDGKWAMSRRTLCDLFGKADPALLDSGPCEL
jgi:hypothetical protein